ncbi:MAG: hypothetical protein IJW98_06230 [Clostridia bacterium]|nr:hypothetical protein [Clostridia bacterium]
MKMQDLGFYIKREPTYEPPRNSHITDIPVREPEQKPIRDLPSPRHRPGEPIMYDPPVSGDQRIHEPHVDLFNIDPLR